MKKYSFRQIATDSLISAGFITPGTIISCLVSGASYGYTLLWALFLSYVCAAFFQGQMLRLGIVTQKGYLRNFRLGYSNRVFRFLWVLILSVILFVGAIAYEAVNFSSLQAGMYCIFPTLRSRWILVLLFLLFCLLVISRFYQKMENVLVVLLVLVSVLFLATSVITPVEWPTLLKNLLIPTISGTPNNWLCICSLVGTVVVPYALFMSARDAAVRWKHDLHSARINSLIVILLSGVISIAIMIAAVNNLSRDTEIYSSAAAFAAVFQLFDGTRSQQLLGICLFISAFSCGLMIPVYSAMVVRHFLPDEIKVLKWIPSALAVLVLLGGLLISIRWFTNPIQTVLKMLSVNTLFLPVVPLGFSLVMNNRSLGEHRNSIFDNVITAIIFLMFVYLSMQAFSVIFN